MGAKPYLYVRKLPFLRHYTRAAPFFRYLVIVLLATKNGGFYLGHLKLTKYREEYSEIRGWTPAWYVTSIGDGGIDCDGTEIYDVIAWMEIPKLPQKKKKGLSDGSP